MPEIPEHSATTEFMIQYRAAQRDIELAFKTKDIQLIMLTARRFTQEGRVGVAFIEMWDEQTSGGQRAN